jgi:hypothetical protein
VVAGKILAHVRTVHRFDSAPAFASFNGTAPIEVSSGDAVRHRLSPAGDRQLSHVLHMMAITQLAGDTEGRGYYRRKRAAGKSHKEALRCLKRRLSDVVYRQLVRDFVIGPVVPAGTSPRSQPGDTRIQRGRLTPRHRHVGSVTTRVRRPQPCKALTQDQLDQRGAVSAIDPIDPRQSRLSRVVGARCLD